MPAKTVWNPNYLHKCVEKALQLLIGAGAGGPALEFMSDAAEHLDCCETYECRAYRSGLSKAIARVRRERQKQRKKVEPWEHWIFEAAEALLQPIPGCKHRATLFLRNAIAEYDEGLGHYPSALAETWKKWLAQHEHEIPSYVPSIPEVHA